MRNKSTIFTLLPFQGVNGFTNDNPTQGAASLALGILCYPPNFRCFFCVNLCNRHSVSLRNRHIILVKFFPVSNHCNQSFQQLVFGVIERNIPMLSFGYKSKKVFLHSFLVSNGA